MWTAHSDELFNRQVSNHGSTVPLHNVDASSGDHQTTSGSESPSTPDASGRWGERDKGPAIDVQQGMEEFRQQLTRLSTVRSRSTRRESLWRTATGISRMTTRTADQAVPASGSVEDLEQVGEGGFVLGDFLREGHFEKRTEGHSAKKVGVIFKNLTVKGVASSATKVKTLPKAILGTFGPDLCHLIRRLFPMLLPKRQQPMKEIIHDFTGVLRDGEMMLVLGRPGSGCSTFLKAIANDRAGYAEVSGDVSYGGIPANELATRYVRASYLLD